MGHPLYREAEAVLVCADSGGSNGYRLRLWKFELQRWANEAGLDVTVCHYPPGTSKWNKIEHRLFSEITKNWRGRPLESYRVVVISSVRRRRKRGSAWRPILTGSFIRPRLRSVMPNSQPSISILTTSMGSGTIPSKTTAKCNDYSFAGPYYLEIRARLDKDRRVGSVDELAVRGRDGTPLATISGLEEMRPFRWLADSGPADPLFDRRFLLLPAARAC